MALQKEFRRCMRAKAKGQDRSFVVGEQARRLE